MRLDRFEYTYNEGLDNEWTIEDCQLNQINLIVGKNASGKSRILRPIYVLSELLTEKIKLGPNDRKYKWNLYFNNDNPKKKTQYLLEMENGLVVKEELIIGDETLLNRDKSGEGNIKAVELGREMRFQSPQTELAVVKRRDTIQHPFLEDIYQWANSLRFYKFGTQLGKDLVASIPPKIELVKKQTDFKNDEKVIGIFWLGENEFKDDFTNKIIEDMVEIGYQISKIGIKVPYMLEIADISDPDDNNNLPQFLYVKENDLKGITEQSEMSQGMFRALSLFIQINYSLLAEKPSCIIIDDIGEGLDYERASAIIKLLIKKAEKGLIQLIMTTNDQSIMNGVPLEYWSVIERKPGSAKLHNQFNSKEKFEEFEFIGLNNFDFFTSEFALHGFSEEE
ncbi:ATP-binding protein [Crocosphaera sp. Alani8]|uniref:ATP-binding protein n=1 Tax=Crocosphaera sp. Alani8 TaxID=3038952 RepID=UPI00313EBBAC